MIYSTIENLLHYGIKTGLMEKADQAYVRNRMLELLSLSDYDKRALRMRTFDDEPLEDILTELVDYALEHGLCDESLHARSRFTTAVMGLLTPPPSAVRTKFKEALSRSPEEATDYLYTLSQYSNYISAYRTAMDKHWSTKTEYGDIEILINLAKPEKDPRDIAAARMIQKSGYPACVLCMENEGYAGRVDHPARQNHRVVPLKIAGEDWALQYSPYVYFNEHCIILNQRHIPMVIDRHVFKKLFSFVEQFPHYFVGSNADLPLVGGSILIHEHFQGGRHTFALENAPIEQPVVIKGFEDVCAGIVKWPMSTLRIQHENKDRLVALGAHILNTWRGYSDDDVCVYAYTGEMQHNTAAPVARLKNGVYELDLILRNNNVSPEHPTGMFHPHKEIQNIKNENFGLIEAMGLAVMPGRLMKEMETLKSAILHENDLNADPQTKRHAAWAKRYLGDFQKLHKDNIDEKIESAISATFVEGLHHAGVFKRDDSGRAAFIRFIQSL
ncbi:UDP-glucose--hexose-1-phosphate uridylyltransferase [Christensenellaceae bacterium OttesenSCG-928-M15]|nr:UDP-glucose--hexose-1-phosphate uridylyltransferase [Christensenellaceae bacterium OttesenSCG-928-M15]